MSGHADLSNQDGCRIKKTNVIMKRFLYLLVAMATTFLPVQAHQNADKTSSASPIPNSKESVVLTIGTIHGEHRDNPNYSYEDIYHILATFKPDVICVEIPPSYFRERPYLTEMMLAVIYGFQHKKEVYPIDWWTDADWRGERRVYMSTAAYKQKKTVFDSLVKSNDTIQAFINKYGTEEDLWKKNRMGYRFFNGKDYNNYTREMYHATIAAFGDGCMNLYSEDRNKRMMDLINEAIVHNEGKRVVILTGAEHKYFFDRELLKNHEITLMQLDSLLPLSSEKPDSVIGEFIDKGLAQGYYTKDETMYRTALTPLVHSYGMDDDPASIPGKNIDKAAWIIRKWETSKTNSPFLDFEKAWVCFLQKDYHNAIDLSGKMKGLLEKIPQEEQDFIISFFWRNLGFCYDMVGKRQLAISAYRKGKEYCKSIGMSKEDIQDIYHNYETLPYHQ